MFRRGTNFALAIASVLALPAAAPAADRLLVLSKAESKLSIVDPTTLEVIARVPTGQSPHEVCTSADGKLAYVADYGTNVPGKSITVIDIDAAKPVKTIDLGPLRRPHGIAEHNGKIYFTAETNACVGRFDPAADKIDMIVGTGMQGSHMLAIDPADGRVYTTNIGSDSVTALDPQRGPGGSVITSHVTVPNQPEGIALSADGKELWAGPRLGGSIAVIDTATDTVKQTIDFPGVAIRITPTPDGSKMLVSDAKNHELVAFDAKTKERAGAVPVGNVPVGCAVAPDSSRAFLSCTAAHKVLVIDLKDMKQAGEIDAGPVPDGIWYAAEKKPALPAAAAARKPGMLGAQLEQVGMADVAKLKLEMPTGALVMGTGPNTPAAAAGLQAGDVILSVNGTPIPDRARLLRILGRASAGDELTLDVLRDGQKQEIKVTLAPRPG